VFDKLSTIEARYEELMHRLGTSEVQSDPAEYRKAAKALSDMEPLVQKYREYKTVEQDIAGSEELARGSDAEMRALAEEELKALHVRRETLLEEIKILLIPKDPNDEKNVILEVRAGTGGEEAALFAAELFNMYQRYGSVRAGIRRDVGQPWRRRRVKGSHRVDRRARRLQSSEVRKRCAPGAAGASH
jgi:peptide chain release factor 1